jgi:hypothetical protein
MIASFKDITDSFGENKKSIEFFKRQVEGLVNIGQLNYLDVILFYNILDIYNTNLEEIDWIKLNKNLNEYIETMSKVVNIKNKDSVYYLLTDNNNISKQTKKVIFRTLDIKDEDYKISSKDNDISFGSYEKNNSFLY